MSPVVPTLDEVFDRCRAEGRAALVAYLPAGFPTVEESIEAARTVAREGADIIEVGIAYSDPMMDGPTIQRATEKALANGVRTRDVFRVVEAVAEAGAVPLVMTYWNPVLAYGVDAFARDLAAAGGRGVITPDLIPEEAGEWMEASKAHGVDRIFLVAPSSTPERLALTVDACSGFVYAASTMGVTGARDAVSNLAPELVARVRAHSDANVGVGLGVRSGAQAAEIARYADGVIVGSALIDALSAGGDALAELTRELAAGVRGRTG